MGIGTPDWLKPTQLRSQNQFPSASVVIPSLGSIGPDFSCANFQGVQFKVAPQTGGVLITLLWFDDFPPTSLIDGDEWYADQNTMLNVVTPVKGLVADVTISNILAANNTVNTYAAGLQSAGNQYIYPVTSNFIGINSKSLAHGASITYKLPAIQPGHAWLMFNPYDTSGKLTIEIQARVGISSGTFEILTAQAPTATLDEIIGLPAQAVQVIVTNTDGVSGHSFDLTLAPMST